MTIENVYNYWFKELSFKEKFKKDEAQDRKIESDFGDLLIAARQGELYSWRETAKGSLCEIVILDQFSRNVYRDTPSSFSADPMALTLSQEAIRKGFDKELSQEEKAFLYMPFMHSESLVIHNWALKLFNEEGLPYEFEVKHRNIIEKFGRYPHRNEILGRKSTAEEIEFLKGPNSSF